MKTIFLFLNIRAYVSDLLKTPYIEYLATKYRVVVFLPEGEGYNSKDYFQHENITYVLIPFVRGRFFTIFDSLLRNEFIRRFDDNPAVIWRNKRTKEPRRLFLRAIGRFFPKRLFGPDFFTPIETFFVPGFPTFRRYVDQYRPSLVLTATLGVIPFDALGLLWARKARVPTATVNFSWDNLTVYPRHVRKSDYLICWNDVIKKEAIELHGFRKDKVFVSGIPRFDCYFTRATDELSREAFLKAKGLDPDRRTVLYAAKTQGEFYLDFLRAFILWQKRGALPSLNMFVRLHPLDSLTSYEEFIDIPNIHIERPGVLKQDDTQGGHKTEMSRDDILNMKYTLTYSDLCVNVSSTVSVEAMVFDKPVINIGFVPEFSDILSFPHYRPLIEKHAVRVAGNMDEVRTYIDQYLKDPSLDRAGRKEIVKAMVGPTDGFSYKRNVDFLDIILKNTRNDSKRKKKN